MAAKTGTAPNRIELEAKIIGAILNNSDVLYSLPANLTDATISQSVLARVLRAIQRESRASKLAPGALDLAAVCAWAGLDSETTRVMLERASELARGCAVEQVAGALLDQHRRSAAVELLTRSLEGFRGGDVATEEVITQVATGILDLDRPGAAEVSDTRESLLEALDGIEACQLGGSLSTGFADFDRKLKIRPGNLIVLAARPGGGKSTFALNIACNVARYREETSAGKKVLIHSMEMSRAELMSLALSRAARIDSQRLFEQATITPAEWERIAAEGDKIGRNGNLLFNTQYASLSAICSITRKQHRKNKLAIVVVDYLQLVKNIKKHGTRENEVSEISGTLKSLAQELEVPILALSQLNRESVKKDAPRRGRDADGPAMAPPPALHELRESGAIEQDANAVVFLHNPFSGSDDPTAKEHGPYDVIIAKQRLGRRGVVQLRADLAMSEFRPFAH